MPVHLLIVDDREVVRAELHAALELFAGVAVVGEARDGADALRQARALKPEIVLMDLEMPGLDGFEAARLIKRLPHPPAVIALTVHDDALHRRKSQQAGVDAFVVKGTDLCILLALFEKLSQPPKP